MLDAVDIYWQSQFTEQMYQSFILDEVVFLLAAPAEVKKRI